MCRQPPGPQLEMSQIKTFALFARTRTILVKVGSLAGEILTTWMSLKGYSSVWLKFKNCPAGASSGAFGCPSAPDASPHVVLSLQSTPGRLFNINHASLPSNSTRTIYRITRCVSTDCVQ
jgi:hypothetical protein